MTTSPVEQDLRQSGFKLDIWYNRTRYVAPGFDHKKGILLRLHSSFLNAKSVDPGLARTLVWLRSPSPEYERRWKALPTCWSAQRVCSKYLSACWNGKSVDRMTRDSYRPKVCVCVREKLERERELRVGSTEAGRLSDLR